jgi:hypothetical protein
VIVGEAAIAVQLVPLREQPLDVVERVRAVRVARDEHALPRRQRLIELGADLVGPPPQRLDGPLALRRSRHHAERLDLFQQDADRFFEFEKICHKTALEKWSLSSGQ